MKTKNRNTGEGPSGWDYVGTVRKHIRTRLRYGHPSIASTAEELGVSVRTLQRRLHVAGTSYSTLIEEVRMERACDLLEASAIPLQDIAGALGYAGASSLSRLVARKTGKTPRCYRREFRKRT